MTPKKQNSDNVNDQSDRKSLNLLVNKLADLKSLKQSSLNSFVESPGKKVTPKKPAVRKKKSRSKKPDYKLSPKITDFKGWIETDKKKIAKMKAKEEKEVLQKPDCSKELNFGETKSNNKKDGYVIHKKYGVRIPTIETILRENREIDEFKASMAKLNLAKYTPAPDYLEEVLEFERNLCAKENLDCKHMSDEDLIRAFKRNFQYAHDIFYGIQPSERHDRYHSKRVFTNTFSEKDLTYNTVTITFTYPQKKLLINLLKEKFSDRDYSEYFFKVLLPELCLKIFMDEHKMDKQQALAYLDRRPC